ncbi:MAG: DUF4862 family protein [Chitinophagaceae bacterium]|nr:DUF4862 family protein [Oligoflexus sp.]
MKGWFLGAYAGYASFAAKTADTDAAYMQGLQELPHLAGLELPFYSDLSETASDRYLRTLPKHWDYVLTLLPGTMQSLANQPDFGLASPQPEGRKAAMSRMTLVHRRLHEINARCGRQAVQAIEVHSAPSGPQGSTEALYRSFEELSAWDWQGARLMLEHCDAWKPNGTSVKGFLPLHDELGVLKQLDERVTMSLNWGRSALEAQSGDEPLNHIKKAQDSGLLGAFFFSGTALNDPLYGSWTDSHVPLRLPDPAPWQASQGLLTPAVVTGVCRVLQASPYILWGIKVQPAPASLSVAERLDFLAQQILGFEQARLAV